MSKPKKAHDKTSRIPASFDFDSLTIQQRKTDAAITETWNGLCSGYVSLGRLLNEQHVTFVKSGEVKAGGPGSRWGKYLAAKGIPRTTACDVMQRAKDRDTAGIPEKAERHLASVGILLDKPKVTDALLRPELREKVAAIKTLKQAEALKPLILELARTAQRKPADRKLLGTDAADIIAKDEALTKSIGYLGRYTGKKFLDKFEEFVRELTGELEDKFKDRKAPDCVAVTDNKLEAAVGAAS